jgi:ATP-binding cassette subfamily C protein LapB
MRNRDPNEDRAKNLPSPLKNPPEFVQKLPDGLDHMIMEGGFGLSGGQLQSLLLARLLIKKPNVLLLDEPTASLDEMTEKSIIHKLNSWVQGKTLLVATHRMNMLSLVDRIIVIENGQIILDGEKEKVLELLAKTTSKSAPATVK